MSLPEVLFISPLLGPDDAWSGYRVEFALGQNSFEALNELCASPLVSNFDSRHPWFFPAIIGSSVKSALGERVVTIFPAQPGALEMEALKQFEASQRQSRCKVGLQAAPEEKLPATGAWDYLLISASHARSLPPYALLGLASRSIVVATHVHSYNDRDWALNNGCSLTSSEFLQTRLSRGKKADMSRLRLLEMLVLIAEDADTGSLEAIFRQEPKLSYSLLRLVNSAAISPRNPIASFSQAINLLGRRQLQRWLQLLVYADPNNGQHPNPLLQKAAARGRKLEILASLLNPPPAAENLQDAAFMVGTFSLLDALLNMSIKEILAQLPLTEIIHDALAERAGALGQLLSAIDAAEAGELQLAAKKLNDLEISAEAFRDAQLTAYSWAAHIRSAS